MSATRCVSLEVGAVDWTAAGATLEASVVGPTGSFSVTVWSSPAELVGPHGDSPDCWLPRELVEVPEEELLDLADEVLDAVRSYARTVLDEAGVCRSAHGWFELVAALRLAEGVDR